MTPSVVAAQAIVLVDMGEDTAADHLLIDAFHAGVPPSALLKAIVAEVEGAQRNH